MLTHIASLKDAVITLSDADNDTVDYKKAQKVVNQIKRNSDTSNDSNTRRRFLRFRKISKNNSIKFFSYRL